MAQVSVQECVDSDCIAKAKHMPVGDVFEQLARRQADTRHSIYLTYRRMFCVGKTGTIDNFLDAHLTHYTLLCAVPQGLQIWENACRGKTQTNLSKKP